MQTQNLVEITALMEMQSKYGLDIELQTNFMHDLLFGMYHFGYNLIKEHVKPEYEEAFKRLTKEEWQFYITDMNALMSQLTESNYSILLNDIKTNQHA